MSIAVCMALGVLGGCRDTFDPRAPLQPQLVVFSVLSTDRDAQFVRVHNNYMPQDYNPLSYTSDNAITGATVTIVAPNKTYQLRDTLIWGSDTTRYTFPLHSYYASPFTPQRGKLYIVGVVVQSFSQITSTVTIPDQAKISLSTSSKQVLDHPDKSALDAMIDFTIQLSKNAKGYTARFYVWYDVLIGTEWVEEAAEIPVRSFDSAPYTLELPVYARMTVSPANAQVVPVYRNGYYKGIINKLNYKYRTTQIIFKWITMVVLQADRNLFYYFLGAHDIEDPHSVRLDEPLVSTLTNGVGMVGGYSLDSLVYLLPYDFWGNREAPGGLSGSEHLKPTTR